MTSKALSISAASYAIFNCGFLDLNSGNLRFRPLYGNLLADGNGDIKRISDTPLTLAATGLTPGTLYYIYAYDNDADGTLDTPLASATVPVTAANGVDHKTGAANRIKVGMARPDTGPAWVNSASKQFVRSWFNRQPAANHNTFSTGRQTTSTSFVEINSEIRIEALLWANEGWFLIGAGTASVNNVATNIQTGIGVDSTTAHQSGAVVTSSPGSNYLTAATTQCRMGVLGEGYHYATILGCVGANTGTWRGASADSQFLFTGFTL